LAVATPLMVFFVRYPAYLTLRADAIAADAPERGPAVVIANVGRVLWGLVWRGDPNPILNLPGRPLLDVAQSVFFIVGVIVCLRQKKPCFSEKTWFLLLWAAVMYIPSVVSGIAPTFGRSIGGVLPVAILVAIGMETTWAFIVARWARLRSLAALTILGALVFSIGLTARDYFSIWARLPGLPQTFHEDLATIGRYIGELPDETVVYITPTQKYYATLLLAMGKRDRPRDFYGPAGLLPAGDPEREAVYLILEGDETTASLLEVAFPVGRWDTRNAIFAAYRVPPAAGRARPQYAVHADFASLVRLVGFDLLSTGVRPGDTLSVRLTWQSLALIDRHYTAFVHLLGPHNSTLDSPLWAQDDHEPGYATYSTDRWFPGEVIVDTFDLQVPGDAPPGAYTLSTGFYDLETLERLPRSDGTGDTATMTTITLMERTP
jgi:hypothetical protein